MRDESLPSLHIGLVGGGDFCLEVLEKTSSKWMQNDFNASITAVADDDPESPGMVLAEKLGIATFSDYHKLYSDRLDIQLIIILTKNHHVFEDILNHRPPHIRILSYQVFELFWNALGQEARKLHERTEELSTVLNGIQDFILVITPDMNIIDANESFLSQMGYSRDEVIGRKCHEVFQNITHQCNEQNMICPLSQAIRNRRTSQAILTRLNQHGDLRYLEINIHPVWEKDGRISKFIEISRDITKRIKQEDEITRRLEQMVEERTRQLQETHTKLLHQDKMASLGKLSASVVHEINNPIAGVINLILLIKRILEEGPVGRAELSLFMKYLDMMESETRRISRIVLNLLAFSRQSKIETKRLNLNRLLDKTLFLNANLLKINRVKVLVKMDPDLPDVIASEDQLQQVFMNLISNAAEAIDAESGGELTVVTGLSGDKKKVTISFSNTGASIPPENISRIFEPFYTTKKKGKGVGLGLSVVYGIIQEHGGTIFVDSYEEKGTTFKVNLPLAPDAGRINRQGGLHGKC